LIHNQEENLEHLLTALLSHRIQRVNPKQINNHCGVLGEKSEKKVGGLSAGVL
jgi:hypothetical protein